MIVADIFTYIVIKVKENNALSVNSGNTLITLLMVICPAVDH